MKSISLKMIFTWVSARLAALRRRLPFHHPTENMALGEVLRKHGVISEKELAHALAVQKEKLVEKGQAVPLGIIISELGYADENVVIQTVNEHYKLSVASLSDDIRGLVGRLRGTFIERLPLPRVPIWLQLTAATVLMISITTLVLYFVILSRQKEQLYDQTLRIGAVSLNFFNSNARIPLMEDDVLRLNSLIRSTADEEGLVYAFIIDNSSIIKAHTDLRRIGESYRPAKPPDQAARRGQNNYYNIELPDGRQVLDISRPIRFRNKKLGQVHVGVSIDFIQQLIVRERSDLVVLSAAILLFGIALAVVLGLYYSLPLRKLVTATQEIGKGNYHHRVVLNRNDELGNLAAAFNQMNAELWKNTLMKESFGKYVGNEVLDMILANPQSTWLTGHRNEATILFADVRGFTALAAEKEPEVVVEMLNRLFETATDAIISYGGYVDKFIGDAVLGVFGVPIFRKDHVERAVRAALAIQEELQEKTKNGIDLFGGVGIGIDTGVIVSGNIGSQAKMEYTVIGDSVNIASRLNAVAGAGEVIVSQAVCGQLDSLATMEELPARQVKGRNEPIKTFRVIAMENRPHVGIEN